MIGLGRMRATLRIINATYQQGLFSCRPNVLFEGSIVAQICYKMDYVLAELDCTILSPGMLACEKHVQA
jgi:hypothetical protein